MAPAEFASAERGIDIKGVDPSAIQLRLIVGSRVWALRAPLGLDSSLLFLSLHLPLCARLRVRGLRVRVFARARRQARV